MIKEVSVIIPCYNAEDHIDRCLRSLECQTIGLDAIELICVDDASTDKTPAILSEWAQRYPDHMFVITLSENGRQGRARNIALSHASCTWVAFVDADDWLDSDFLERLLSVSSEAPYDIISCGIKRNPSPSPSVTADRSFSLPRTTYHITNDTERKSFFQSYPLSYTACGRLIRKSFLTENQITFPEGLAYEDTFFGALCSIYATHVRLIDEYLYHYYVNHSSTVLAKDAPHHIDLLTVQELLWNEFASRGFMKRFPDELQYEYLFSCCLAFWKIIALRDSTPPYAYYRLLCAVAHDKIDGFEQNPYVRAGGLKEHYVLMIRSLLIPLSEKQFSGFVDNILQIRL